MTNAIELYFKLLKWLVVLCLAGMIILVFGNVVLRYIFNSGITESEEFSRWLFVWMVFLGAIIVLRENGHLGLEFIVNSFPRPVRIVCLAIGHVMMIFATWLIISGTWIQTSVNLHTYAPATGFSLAFFYGVGLIFGVSTGLILLHRLWLILTGQMDRVGTTDLELAAVDKVKVE
ncbi:TRAP transporter small permease [Falsihalocynthiibacter arcticus]|uniref:TRAP transporter small permease protein n=1 Tax=Falsihalocynthiibacter arcticus TaxID=1579316 RepID=A0A126UX30_9RHOB|nr:TRAP transporter small permease [Falsihalocynthiibacter arcticus]AML50437.1 C4-dicarboxylate ABC transporter permease [Falsihalocynthiibacter arcticus]